MVLLKTIPIFIVCKSLQMICLWKIFIKMYKLSIFTCVNRKYTYNGNCPKGWCMSYNIPRHTLSKQKYSYEFTHINDHLLEAAVQQI